MSLNPNYAPNALKVKAESPIADSAAEFLAASLVPSALLNSVDHFNKFDRSGDMYLAMWLETRIFESNKASFNELISKIKIGLSRDTKDPKTIVVNAHRDHLSAALESVLRQNPDALEAFVSREDVVHEHEASKFLVEFIDRGILEGREDLAQKIVDNIHGWNETRKNIPGFQGPGKWFDNKISETERTVLAALTQAGFTIQSAPVKERLSTTKAVVARKYYEADIQRAVALRAQLEEAGKLEIFVDQVERQCTGFNDQDYIDRFMANLRYAMDGASEQVTKAGRILTAAILDQGYVIKLPADVSNPAVQMIDPRQI